MKGRQILTRLGRAGEYFETSGSPWRPRAATLDTLDWKILEILQHEGRSGWSELGRRVGLSQSALSVRI